MDETRIRLLEEHVMDLRITQGKQDTLLEQLSKQLNENKITMETLNDTINKSRGALMALTFVAGGLGSLAGWFVHLFSENKH